MRTELRAAAFVVSLFCAAVACAQPNYPIKPVRLIVPFPPGGGTDITARMVAAKLSESFRHTVIVDNRPGGGGTIGIETAVKSSPDGYTLILLTTGYTTNAALGKLAYDPVNDVSPIALVGETGFVVILNPWVPVKSIKALIAYDEANPGKLNYGSAGTGGITHVATELLNHMAGIKMTHVPYKGGPPAMTDLLGGQIQVFLSGLPPAIPHLKSNRLRGIALTSAKRSSSAPDIPTVAETVPGYEAVLWFAVLGPKAVPKEIVTRWNREIDRIVQLPDIKQRMASDGTEPLGGPPERFRDVLTREIAKWQKVVRIANIKVGS
ncbi:MAG: tripartite tricarboxylate transporter substrate binding protein [Betaproteobacteria bacterium]|nr:MAG: tripartite tricarboxylate transporter substrate binding protein [Betaproteobacteria bacterium]